MKTWTIETYELDAPPAARGITLREGKSVRVQDDIDAVIAYGSDGFLAIREGHSVGPLRKTELAAALDVLQDWIWRQADADARSAPQG